MENSIKEYNLRVKKVLIFLFIAGVFVAFAGYMFFLASDKEKLDMFLYELKFSIHQQQGVFGSVYICGLLAIPMLVYMIELLICKTKGVLVLSNEGIAYYAPEYGRIFIPAEKIEKIYITDVKHMKIALKDYEIKEGLRAKILKSLKNIFLGGNAKGVFRINLNFIDCDEKEVRDNLFCFNLLPGAKEANELIADICTKYNCKDIEELKNNKDALKECINGLSNMEKFTQKEIAAITKTSTSKVSKILSKGE